MGLETIGSHYIMNGMLLAASEHLFSPMKIGHANPERRYDWEKSDPITAGCLVSMRIPCGRTCMISFPFTTMGVGE